MAVVSSDSKAPAASAAQAAAPAAPATQAVQQAQVDAEKAKELQKENQRKQDEAAAKAAAAIAAKQKVAPTSASLAAIKAGDVVIATGNFTFVIPNGDIMKVIQGAIISDAGAIHLCVEQNKPVRVATQKEIENARGQQQA